MGTSAEAATPATTQPESQPAPSEMDMAFLEETIDENHPEVLRIVDNVMGQAQAQTFKLPVPEWLDSLEGAIREAEKERRERLSGPEMYSFYLFSILLVSLFLVPINPLQKRHNF